MQILADNSMTGVTETFARQGQVRRYDGRELTRDDLGEAEVLLVRSVTRVDAALLEGSRVRFVGTATIGTDHLDTRWLDQQGIAWASAPGCNADAAAQYTLGMMLLANRRLDRRLKDQHVAIIGHGNVGSRVHKLLGTLGAEVTVCDPPLAGSGQIESVTLDQALAADIITLHVPLTHRGSHPTHHMMNREALQKMRPGALLVNAARGAVIHEAALNRALTDGHVHAALDVWPSEPRVGRSLLASTTVATPHVAGYSVQGKLRGTQMIFEAFMAWRGSPTAVRDQNTPGIELLDVSWPDSNGRNIEALIAEAVIQATHVAQDDARMRASVPDSAATFDPLRRAHAPRHEFGRLCLAPPDEATATQLRALGFQVR